MRPRSIGRRLALQYLFMADMNRYATIEEPAEFFKTQRLAANDNESDKSDTPNGFVFDKDDPYQDEAEEFALSIIDEVRKNREAIDAEIGQAAQNWSLSRMGTIERNVIRIASAEFRINTSPRAVILDEAVELAKRFGDKDSGAFVNGIADRLGRKDA